MGNPNLERESPITYGGDDCARKEETAAEVPVAGVGGVAFGVHALDPGFHDDLRDGRKRELTAPAVGQVLSRCFRCHLTE